MNQIQEKKEAIIRAAIAVFDFLKSNPGADAIDTLHFVRDKHDYSQFDKDGLLDLFIIQGGAAYVAFNHIKNNPGMEKRKLIMEIVNRYPYLLSEYYDGNQ